MWWKKLKTTAAAGLAIGLLTAGIGLAGPNGAADPPSPRAERVTDDRPPGTTGPLTLNVGGAVVSLAWSPDGKTIATIGSRQEKEGLPSRTVKLWDARTGKLRVSLGEEAHTLLDSLAFSPDSSLVALSSFQRDREANRNTCQVKVYAVENGGLRETLGSHEWIAGPVAFSPDGKTLATAGIRLEPFQGPNERAVGEVKLWDTRTWKVNRKLDILGDLEFVHRFGPIDFSADGKLLACGTIRYVYTPEMVPAGVKVAIGLPHQTLDEVVVWDFESGKVKRRLGRESFGSTRWRTSVVFAPKGTRLASADSGGTLKLWDAGTGKLERTIAAPSGGWLSQAVFSPDGKAVATVGMEDEGGKPVSRVKLWDADTGEPRRVPADLAGSRLAFAPDGNRLAIASADTVRIWDLAGGKE
jgi:WD40 repeat protein